MKKVDFYVHFMNSYMYRNKIYHRQGVLRCFGGIYFESSVSKWKLAISYCIHCTIRYAEAHGVLLSCFRTNPHPWKLQNRYVCPDGIFPAGPLLASGRPKESHFSSHFIGPYHLFLYLSCTSKLWQFGWPNISGFDPIPNLIPAQYVSEISSWCNFFCF